ncbi:MAG: hypothetical protein PHP66_00220 [Syntrophales bacterium]|nr:hypothetical protein [Syntrophales bacterium]
MGMGQDNRIDSCDPFMPEVGRQYEFPHVEAVVEITASIHQHFPSAREPDQETIPLTDVHRRQGKSSLLSMIQVEIQTVDAEYEHEDDRDSLQRERHFRDSFRSPPRCKPVQKKTAPDQQKVKYHNFDKVWRRYIQGCPAQRRKLIDEDQRDSDQKFRDLDYPSGQCGGKRHGQDNQQRNRDCQNAEDRNADEICRKRDQRQAVEIE